MNLKPDTGCGQSHMLSSVVSCTSTDMERLQAWLDHGSYSFVLTKECEKYEDLQVPANKSGIYS